MKIIAHRGDTANALGNSMEAFESAAQAGVYGIEFDIRLTQDHIPMIHHNMMLDTDTEKGFVEDYTHQQIQAFRTTVDGVRYQIPSLMDVLDSFCGKLYLEIHVLSVHPQAIQSVADCLKDYRPYWSQCEITSFEPAILLGFQEECTGITRDLLFQPEAWMTPDMAIRAMLAKATLANASHVHLLVEQFTQQAVERFQDAGFGVHAALVNNQSELKSIQSAGIEQFSSDNIHLFLDKD